MNPNNHYLNFLIKKIMTDQYFHFESKGQFEMYEK